MIDDDTEISEEAIFAMVRRYRELGSAIAELREEQEEIKEAVSAAVPVGWKTSVDGVAAHRRAPNRSFDLISAVALLGPEDRSLCQVTRFDEKMVRARVESLGLLDECMIVNPTSAPVVKL